jgi:hypothetical protein
MLPCPVCKQRKPAADFPVKKGGGWESRCKTCDAARKAVYAQRPEVKARHNELVKASYHRDREKIRERAKGRYDPAKNKDQLLRSKFGLTLADYEAMLEAQGGVCAICLRPERKENKSLNVDHCHSTGIVRGLLCGPCNTGLGMFSDDPERIMAAISYLEEGEKENHDG